MPAVPKSTSSRLVADRMIRFVVTVNTEQTAMNTAKNDFMEEF